jgi:predicted secreted protein
VTPVPVTLGLGDNRREIRVSANDVIEIRLPENPSTGVRWSLEESGGTVEVVGDRYEQESGAGVGAAATRVFTLKSRSHGRTSLRFKRWQEWEGPASVDATFECVLRFE